MISFCETIGTPDARRRRAIGQILLLAAALVVLVAISTLSVVLVNQARKDNAWVVHTVEVENQISTLLFDARTADLREANNEIQRFAYIVSHDLRSPLVNIMGFTSELEELRTDIFRRIGTLRRVASEFLLVVQFQHSHRFSAGNFANAGIEGRLANTSF